MKIKAMIAAALVMASVSTVSAAAAPFGNWGHDPGPEPAVTTTVTTAATTTAVNEHSSGSDIICLDEEDIQKAKDGEIILAKKNGEWQIVSSFQSVDAYGRTNGLLKMNNGQWEFTSNDPNTDEYVLITSEMIGGMNQDNTNNISDLMLYRDFSNVTLVLYKSAYDSTFSTFGGYPVENTDGAFAIDNIQLCLTHIRDLMNGNIQYILMEKDSSAAPVSFKCADNINRSDYLLVKQEQICSDGKVYIADNTVLDKVWSLKNAIADEQYTPFYIDVSGDEPYLTDQHSQPADVSSTVSTSSTTKTTTASTATTRHTTTTETVSTKKDSTTDIDAVVESTDTTETTAETTSATEPSRTTSTGKNKSSGNDTTFVMRLVFEILALVIFSWTSFLIIWKPDQ